MTAIMLLLERATCKAAAMGPALMLLKASDRLTPREWRWMDAHVSNEEFIKEFAAAMADVISRHPVVVGPERTNEQVRTFVPGGREAIEDYFAKREANLVKALGRHVLAAFRKLEDDPLSSPAPSVYTEIAYKVRDMMIDDKVLRDVDQQASDQTAYRWDPAVHSETEIAEHHRALRELMRDLRQPRSPEEIAVICELAKSEADIQSAISYPSTRRDEVQVWVSYIIQVYVRLNGPPPIGTPLHHIAIYERQVISLIHTGSGDWAAGEKWLAAGLLDGEHVKRKLGIKTT